jgi:hypothetical protein
VGSLVDFLELPKVQFSGFLPAIDPSQHRYDPLQLEGSLGVEDATVFEDIFEE